MSDLSKTGREIGTYIDRHSTLFEKFRFPKKTITRLFVGALATFGAGLVLGLVVVGSLAILGGTVVAVVSWIAALVNTWQLEDKLWFAALLALGLLGFGVIAMIAYVVAGPDGTKQRVTPALALPAAPSS